MTVLLKTSSLRRTTGRAARARQLRRWAGLFYLFVFAAGGIYEPLHVLSESHHDELSLLGLDHCGRGTGGLGALEEDHHSSHEPHSVGDHLPNLLRPERVTLGPALLPAFTQLCIAPDRAPVAGEPIQLRSIVRPGPSPPATPLKPRAPPPS